jgi:hypothetical protein
MILNKRNVLLLTLVSLLSLVPLLNFHNLNGIYLTLILFSLIAITSQPIALVLLVNSSVFFEKIGYYNNYYLQTKLAILLLFISILLLFNKKFDKDFLLKIKIVQLLLIILLIFLISIKLTFQNIDLILIYFKSVLFFKMSDNVLYYYIVMISRWSGIMILAYIVINNKRDIKDLILGLGLSLLPLLFSLNTDILYGIYNMCSKPEGFDGFQTPYLNRADFSYKISLSLIVITIVAYYKFKNNLLTLSLMTLSTILIGLSAGKGGILAYIICLIAFLIYNKKILIFFLIASLSCFYFFGKNSGLCNVDRFMDQHFNYSFVTSVSTRLSFYNSSVKNMTLRVPSLNANQIKLETTNQIDKSKIDQTGLSGTHNIFFDIINQYGLLWGLFILFLLLFPLLYFLKTLILINKEYSFIYLSLLIILMIYLIFTAALHVAILLPFFYCVSIIGIGIYRK